MLCNVFIRVIGTTVVNVTKLSATVVQLILLPLPFSPTLHAAIPNGMSSMIFQVLFKNFGCGPISRKALLAHVGMILVSLKSITRGTVQLFTCTDKGFDTYHFEYVGKLCRILPAIVSGKVQSCPNSIGANGTLNGEEKNIKVNICYVCVQDLKSR